jgi:23S rRNA (cytosine1962-C5)-methyltransferase
VAFERLFAAFRDERVIYDGDDLLVVDKPSGIVVHGGDERRADDLVTRLALWLKARGESDYLGVHQRLDTGTSGVIVFTRRPDENAAIARQMEAHSALRVYVAAVSLARESSLAQEGTLEHRLDADKRRTRVVKSGGQLARTHYRVLSRRDRRALIELRPETGRMHQLRAQLAAAGAPIAGDVLYGGLPEWRLLLHARLTELGSDRRFEAPLPEDFESWITGTPLGLGSTPRVRDALLDAAVRRFAVARSSDAFRIVNDAGDGLRGLTVDRYGDFAVLSPSSDEAMARVGELAKLVAHAAACGVYVKARARADLRRAEVGELAPRTPALGNDAPERLEVHEADLRLWVELHDGLSTGLFVDQRENRERVRELAKRARVLNLFSYTCAFSVAAALGGANRVTSVGLSKRALERGKGNFRLNGLSVEAHEFVQADAVKWLERARERKTTFDLVVFDPPSFATVGKGGTFRARDDYARTVALALALLGRGGRLLAVTNHRKTSLSELRKWLRDAAAKARREIRQLKDLPSGADCPAGPDGPFPSKSVLVTLA